MDIQNYIFIYVHVYIGGVYWEARVAVGIFYKKVGMENFIKKVGMEISDHIFTRILYRMIN